MHTRDAAHLSAAGAAGLAASIAHGGTAPLFHRVCDACFGRDSCERVCDQVLVCEKKTELCAVLQVLYSRICLLFKFQACSCFAVIFAFVLRVISNHMPANLNSTCSLSDVSSWNRRNCLYLFPILILFHFSLPSASGARATEAHTAGRFRRLCSRTNPRRFVRRCRRLGGRPPRH
jgi:hypothetical protein